MRRQRTGQRFSGVRFRIETVYQGTVAEVEAALRAQTTERDFAELGAAVAALAQVNRRDPGVADVPRVLLVQPWTGRGRSVCIAAVSGS